MTTFSSPLSPGPLRDRTVAITGRLASMSRREAWRLVGEAGGRPTARVTRRTDVLVVGMHGWAVLADRTASRKLVQAERLRDAGMPLQIMSETAFLEAIGQRSPRPGPGPRTCTLEQACRLLDVPPEVIRRCDQFGLVRVEGEAIDFQDLVSLRALIGLLRQGLTTAAVARGLSRLAPFLPEMERPLAQIRLASEAGEVVAELQGARINARGQLLFDFSGGTPIGISPVALAERRRQEDPGSAEDCFAVALGREEAGDPEGAITAYRRALAADPSFVEARYNLANLLLEGGRLPEAEAEYRAAVAADPQMACAWYNLGYLLAEQERFEETAAALGEAIAVMPEYADAHFNLALCLEELGKRHEAIGHWHSFLRLQPKGEWAEIARAHLRLPIV